MAVRFHVIELKPRYLESRMLFRRNPGVPRDFYRIELVRNFPDIGMNHWQAAVAALVAIPGEYRLPYCRSNVAIRIAFALWYLLRVTVRFFYNNIFADTGPRLA